MNYRYRKSIGINTFATSIGSLEDKENYIKNLFENYPKVFLIISEREEFLDVDLSNKDFWSISLRNYGPQFIGTWKEFLNTANKLLDRNGKNNVIVYLNVDDESLSNYLVLNRIKAFQEVIYKDLKDVEDKKILDFLDFTMRSEPTEIFFNVADIKIDIFHRSYLKEKINTENVEDYLLNINLFYNVCKERIQNAPSKPLIIYSSPLEFLSLELWDDITGVIYKNRIENSLKKINYIKENGYRAKMMWCEV